MAKKKELGATPPVKTMSFRKALEQAVAKEWMMHSDQRSGAFQDMALLDAYVKKLIEITPRSVLDASEFDVMDMDRPPVVQEAIEARKMALIACIDALEYAVCGVSELVKARKRLWEDLYRNKAEHDVRKVRDEDLGAWQFSDGMALAMSFVEDHQDPYMEDLKNFRRMIDDAMETVRMHLEGIDGGHVAP